MNRRITQRFLCFFGVLELTALAALAHPVAQGAMDIVVSADCIEIQAHISTEEVFVAEAFGGKADAKGSLDDVWRRHGGYFSRIFSSRQMAFHSLERSAAFRHRGKPYPTLLMP